MVEPIPIKAEPAFDDFWRQWPSNPRKIEKAQAVTKWTEITAPGGVDTRCRDKETGGYMDLHLEATPAEILRAARYYWAHTESAWLQTPHIWLNRGRFMDYDPEVVAEWEREQEQRQREREANKAANERYRRKYDMPAR